MASHPPDIRSAPVRVLLFQIEYPFRGDVCTGHVAAGGMNHTLRLTGGPARIKHEQGMLGIQRLSRKVGRHRSDQFVPPDISTGRHVDWFARAFEHHHFLDGWSIDGRIVHIFLKWNYSSSP